MKIRIIIERAAWKYKLHISRAPAGHYFARLTDHGGQDLGTMEASLGYNVDAAINNAEHLYLDLCYKLTLPKPPTPKTHALQTHQS